MYMPFRHRRHSGFFYGIPVSWNMYAYDVWQTWESSRNGKVEDTQNGLEKMQVFK